MSRRFLYRVLLIVVALWGCLFFTGIAFAQEGNDEELVKVVQEKHTARLMAIKGVVGTAIGHDQGDRPDIKILVEREGVAGLPKILDDVSVEVVVTGKIYALNPGGKLSITDPTARFKRPVPIGVSTGHPLITAGTIGCRVKDSAGNIYALSNNHIYANENYASIGDNVLQPGIVDKGHDPKDSIGTLYKFIPIKFLVDGVGEDNYVDAAIALSTTDLLGNATPTNGYGTPKSATVKAKINMPVQKYGRTTGLTKGIIYAKNAWVNVLYSPAVGPANFAGQLLIVAEKGIFSDGGDSGSLIVTNDPLPLKNNKPVGLLFAGGSGITVANPIGAVLDALGVTIDGEE